jgi:hypothetical protein
VHTSYREQDFAECDTRQMFFCRVPDKKHSAKRLALGKSPDSGSVHVYSSNLESKLLSKSKMHMSAALICASIEL